MRRILCCTIAVLSLCCLRAQPQLSISRTKALIGDQLELTLQVFTQPGQQWVNADVVPADTVASIEVVQAFSPEIGQGLVRKKWLISVFDTGIVRVPSVPVILQQGPRQDTLYSNDIPLMIEGIVDSAGMAPIKPLAYEPVRFSDYLPYIAGAIAFVFLVILAVWWWKRPQKQPEIVEIRDEKPAHEHAMIRLDMLESQQLWQKGQVKTYHSELSHIVREYLEKRFGIQALEFTTGEIVAQMHKLDLGQELLDETAQMMNVEDLVKFAKATPPVAVHAEHMTFVRDFIRRTQFVEQTTADV